MAEQPSSYYHIKERKLIIGTTTKVASTSMSQIIGLRPTLSRARVLKMRKYTAVVIWIRNPYARLVSAYHQLGKRKNFSRFVDYAIQTKNRHWQSQIEYHSYKGILLPNIVTPFSLIEHTWPAFMPGTELPHLKKSKGKSWDELKIELRTTQLYTLRSMYDSDIQQILDTARRV